MKEKLRITMIGFVTMVALLGLLTGYYPVRAQDKPPAQSTPAPHDIEAIYRAAYAALNAGDLEGNLQYYAEDAITIALPPPPGVDAVASGKEAILAWTVTFLESHPQIEFTDFHVNGETITVRTVATDDFLKSSGVGYVEFSGTAIVRDGLIVSETYLMDKESLDRLMTASMLATNKAVVTRFYEEIFSKGNMAVADEIIDPSFDAVFTGEKNFAKGTDGVAKLKEAITGFRQMFPDYKIEVSDMVAEGDLVVCNIKGTGTYAGGLEDAGVPASAIGKVVTFYGTDYTRVVNGKMVEAWGTHGDLAWFQQMGMKLVPERE